MCVFILLWKTVSSDRQRYDSRLLSAMKFFHTFSFMLSDVEFICTSMKCWNLNVIFSLLMLMSRYETWNGEKLQSLHAQKTTADSSLIKNRGLNEIQMWWKFKTNVFAFILLTHMYNCIIYVLIKIFAYQKESSRFVFDLTPARHAAENHSKLSFFCEKKTH